MEQIKLFGAGIRGILADLDGGLRGFRRRGGSFFQASGPLSLAAVRRHGPAVLI